jgi:hypothetical protein
VADGVVTGGDVSAGFGASFLSEQPVIESDESSARQAASVIATTFPAAVRMRLPSVTPVTQIPFQQ